MMTDKEAGFAKQARESSYINRVGSLGGGSPTGGGVLGSRTGAGGVG
jgi:hypothetical protein